MGLKAILVGVGGFGRRWVQVLSANPPVEVAALVDINPAALEEAAAKLRVAKECCFDSAKKALAKVKADLLINVTPPAVHKPIALAAFQAGLHVLTEKPLADTPANCRAMVAAASRYRRKLMVSQNYRFAPWARTVRKLIDEQALGALGSCSIRFYKRPDFGQSYRVTMNYPLLVDMSIHHFDLMRYCLHTDPVRVSATGWNPRWSYFRHQAACQVLLEMSTRVPAERAHVTYDANWVARGRETGWNGDWRIECAEGCIWVTERSGEMVVELDPGTGRARLPAGTRGTPPTVTAQAGPVPLVPMPRSGQEYSLSEMVAAISDKREPETSGRDNLKSVAMVFAAVDSIERRQPVEVADYLK
jgi:predicted dehydrogenase